MENEIESDETPSGLKAPQGRSFIPRYSVDQKIVNEEAESYDPTGGQRFIPRHLGGVIKMENELKSDKTPSGLKETQGRTLIPRYAVGEKIETEEPESYAAAYVGRPRIPQNDYLEQDENSFEAHKIRQKAYETTFNGYKTSDTRSFGQEIIKPKNHTPMFTRGRGIPLVVNQSSGSFETIHKELNLARKIKPDIRQERDSINVNFSGQGGIRSFQTYPLSENQPINKTVVFEPKERRSIDLRTAQNSILETISNDSGIQGYEENFYITEAENQNCQQTGCVCQKTKTMFCMNCRLKAFGRVFSTACLVHNEILNLSEFNQCPNCHADENMLKQVVDPVNLKPLRPLNTMQKNFENIRL